MVGYCLAVGIALVGVIIGASINENAHRNADASEQVRRHNELMFIVKQQSNKSEEENHEEN